MGDIIPFSENVRAFQVSSGRIIRVLPPFSLLRLGSALHVTLDVLSERLASQGCRLEFELHPSLFQRHRTADLQRLDALPDTAGWLLLYATESMQRWFAASGRPCVSVGRVYEGIMLPSVEYVFPTMARYHGDGGKLGRSNVGFRDRTAQSGRCSLCVIHS